MWSKPIALFGIASPIHAYPLQEQRTIYLTKTIKKVKDNIQQCSCFTEQQGHASWKGERLSMCQWLITLTPHSHPTHAVTHLRSAPVRASLWEPAWESDQKHRQLKHLSRWNSTKETRVMWHLTATIKTDQAHPTQDKWWWKLTTASPRKLAKH